MKTKVRSMFSNIFGNKKAEYKVINQFKMLNSSDTSFYNWNGKIYDSNIARAAIGTNGINAGKLNPKHIRIVEKDIKVSPNKNIERLLKNPNQYMTMFDFIQKMMIQREENNNAFAYIDRDKNIPGMDGILGIYPINSSSVELYEDDKENLYIKFRFRNGENIFAPYKDIIHIRKHFNENDFWRRKQFKGFKLITRSYK